LIPKNYNFNIYKILLYSNNGYDQIELIREQIMMMISIEQ